MIFFADLCPVHQAKGGLECYSCSCNTKWRSYTRFHRNYFLFRKNV